MCTGAEIAMIGAMTGSTAANLYGANKAANTQTGASKDALNLQKDIYHADLANQFSAGKYAQGGLPNFNVPTSFDVNKMFDVASGNLNRTALGASAEASKQASALAGAGGFANPQGFNLGAFTDTYGSFAPQFGQLETARAGKQYDNMQYGNSLAQLLYQNRFNLANTFGNPNESPMGIGGWRA